VYTVDRQRNITECVDMNVDAIFTNYPQRTIKRLKKTKDHSSNQAAC